MTFSLLERRCDSGSSLYILINDTEYIIIVLLIHRIVFVIVSKIYNTGVN